MIIDASKGVPTDLNITATTPSLLVQNTIIAGTADPVSYSISATTPTGSTSASIRDWFNTNAFANAIFTTNEEVGLIAPFNYAAPDFNPTATSPAATGAVYSHTKLSGLQQVTYKGACAPGDTWWKGWAKY